ncbi:MAG: polysaccharide biosynthesis tyrosine autokinase [Erysipelotrichaceae bacterium]|nr:polysaccharide biosynthesis tyrosine autokinase [Erysipelotrichaceae bacterium]
MADTNTELEKLDITALVDAFLHSLKKLWVLVLVLTLLLGGISFFRTNSTYVSAYKAEATVAVYASEDGGTTINSRSAEQLGTVFPYILTSGILKDVIMQDMGVSSLPSNIQVVNVEGTNLLTITVTSGDPEFSYNTLLSIIKNYPKIAEYVVGYTVMEIVDDSGIPQDSGKTVAVRGNALKGAAVGFALGIAVVVLHMLMYRTIRTSKDVKSFSNFDHLGTLPVYKKKKRKNASSSINILEHNVQQDYLESIRLIRTRVMRKLEESGHKVLMVTSSVPGEGKSTVAANLAISLAGKNKRVILVDCDLRNPSLQDVFRISSEQPGIADVLDGKVRLTDAVVSYEKYGIQLAVLFGSPNRPTSHSEVLGSVKMGEIIERLKKAADIVILDTPPSAMLVDAVLVSKYADEAIYVIMADYARKSVVVDGMQELKSSGTEISGFILNGGKESSSGYGSHYYGYKNHYYGYSEKSDDKK